MNVRKCLNVMLSHKFLITCCCFVVYMLVFSDHSALTIARLRQQETALERRIQSYRDSIDQYEQYLNEVTGDEVRLERFARERLLMHAPGEDVYLVDE